LYVRSFGGRKSEKSRGQTAVLGAKTVEYTFEPRKVRLFLS
jgi:hypothetical protein